MEVIMGGSTRRVLLKYAAAGVAMAPDLAAVRAQGQSEELAPVAETHAGKVRGRRIGGVLTFRGIRYGASTSAGNRFMPPRPLEPWSGLHEATAFGPMAMQLGSPESLPGTFYEGILQPPPVTISEDCLVLNVWTPAVADGRRRPVIFWCHGGAFAGGTGGQTWTDASNLAEEHDIVVVSINHRLNIFGYLYLDRLGGEKYASAGNAGMLDIVAALKWVKVNIASFGGDPGNVTIAGHSGGGMKVNVLMAMPAAHGLFHKAISMSGPGLKMIEADAAHLTAERVLKQLDISSSQIDRVQTASAAVLLKAMQAVLVDEGDNAWRADGGLCRAFAPVVDGRVLPRHPYSPDAPPLSPQIPLLVGGTAEEARGAALATPNFGSMDAQAVRRTLLESGVPPERVDRLIVGYLASRPNAPMGDIYSAILSDLQFRADAIAIAERKSDQNAAPVYMYLFAWNSPAEGGRYRSTHGTSLPFAFDNLDKAPGFLAGHKDPRAQELAHSMGRAWAMFAQTGNPNFQGLPTWNPYSKQDRATLVFDSDIRSVSDPLGQDRLVFQS